MPSEKEFSLCEWVDYSTLRKKLENLLDQHQLTLDDITVTCGVEDEQWIFFDMIRCVPLDLIQHRAVWSPERLERIREWATKWSLNSIPYNRAKQKVKARSLPSLSRTLDIDKVLENNVKYLITDGIHRIARAKELGLPCILAEVTEEIKYTKSQHEKGKKEEE